MKRIILFIILFVLSTTLPVHAAKDPNKVTVWNKFSDFFEATIASLYFASVNNFAINCKTAFVFFILCDIQRPINPIKKSPPV